MLGASIFLFSKMGIIKCISEDEVNKFSLLNTLSLDIIPDF
jgi:hypothetical protein